jgi:hypothetical protein
MLATKTMKPANLAYLVLASTLLLLSACRPPDNADVVRGSDANQTSQGNTAP